MKRRLAKKVLNRPWRYGDRQICRAWRAMYQSWAGTHESMMHLAALFDQRDAGAYIEDEIMGDTRVRGPLRRPRTKAEVRALYPMAGL